MKEIKAKDCLCDICLKKVMFEMNLPKCNVFSTNFQEAIGFPFALVNLGPDEGKFDLKGRRLRAAPVSTKYLL